MLPPVPASRVLFLLFTTPTGRIIPTRLLPLLCLRLLFYYPRAAVVVSVFFFFLLRSSLLLYHYVITFRSRARIYNSVDIFSDPTGRKNIAFDRAKFNIQPQNANEPFARRTRVIPCRQFLSTRTGHTVFARGVPFERVVEELGVQQVGAVVLRQLMRNEFSSDNQCYQQQKIKYLY